jgi:APA family basic amino acid/polyamine antiporter
LLDLERRLGLTSVIAISLGAMLGSGLFVLPGVAATITGPSMWLAFALAGICVLPAALSKAELATAMPTSGGSYVYLERAFGPMVGTICGLGLWMSLLLKSSFALVGLTMYLKILTPVNDQFAALGFLALVTALNILGVRKVGQAQVVMVALSLLGLAVLVFLGKDSFDPQLTQPSCPMASTG